MNPIDQSLLDILLDRMPMAIAVFDRQMRLQRWNPTWAGFVERYTPSRLTDVVAGASLYDLAPGIEESVAPALRQVLDGRILRQDALRLESSGIVSYWDLVVAPLTDGEEVVGIVEVNIDATERVLAYQTLEERVEERTRDAARRAEVAEGIRDILTILNSNRPLDDVLDHIVSDAKRLLAADGVGVYRLEVKDGLLLTQRSQGLEVDYVASMKIPVTGGVVGQTVLQGQPLVLPDIPAIIPNALEQMPDPGQQELLKNLTSSYSSLLAVPLLIKDELYGGMVFYYTESRSFSEEDVGLALALADQAALAIENARLIDQAEEMAVAAERSRLARELHDAVTQTLFSASLLAEVLPQLWEKDAAEGRRRVEELRQLTRGALAEMRTLLLELRPTALVEAELPDLLRQLSEATRGAAGVPVRLKVKGRPSEPLPPDVQIALYRIAQEALNNVSRHSHASEAFLDLSYSAGELRLSVTDDGDGFDPSQVGPERLGLGIMEERAQAIGAEFELGSEPGKGTEIAVVWSAGEAGRSQGMTGVRER
ncbi:MAG: GAF domain-containing protein [Actinobacteria bacterium]|nr:MAG: GAF domain-containing protein [Actinomycetota bacterium]